MQGFDKEYYHEARFVDADGSETTLRVPVVQELARHGAVDVPEMFKRSSSDNLPIVSPGLDSFPLVSMARLRGPAHGREEELAKVAKGLQQWGMLLISDHGLPCSVLADLEKVVKGFFELSFQEKKLSVGTYASVDNMGYGRNFIKPQNVPIDWIDRFTVKVSPKESTYGLNVWPQRPSNFREVLEGYAKEARKLCDELLLTFAEAFSLDKNAFLRNFEPKSSELNVRINHYPPCPRPDLALGFNPHSDASAVSLLLQFGSSSSGALQVMHNQTWVTVPWPKDALLVNVGDLLEIISNGRVKSPWHRVLAQPNVERYSVALFYNPPPSLEILPMKRDDLGAQEYNKVVVGDYLNHVYTICPTTSKEAIKFAMQPVL